MADDSRRNVRGPAAVMLAAVIAGGAAWKFIAPEEGIVLKVYRDPIGRLAACVGHDDPKMQEGRTFTLTECRAMFDEDAQRTATGLSKCIKRDLSSNEALAYLSLGFNIGIDAFCGSTLVRVLNAGDYAAACVAMLNWKYAGGRPILLPRRETERAVCERTT